MAIPVELYEALIVLSEVGIIDPIFQTLIRRVFSFELNEMTDTASARLQGDKIILQFNPKFWAEVGDSYSRAFLVAHEALHVILNHMSRSRAWIERQKSNIDPKNLHEIFNYSADLVINESLLNNGFEKERLSPPIQAGVFWPGALQMVQATIDLHIENGRMTPQLGNLCFAMFHQWGRDWEYYAWWILKLAIINPEQAMQILGEGGQPIESPKDWEQLGKVNPERVKELVEKAVIDELIETNDPELKKALEEIGGAMSGPGSSLLDADGGAGRRILPDKKKLHSLVRSDFSSNMRNAVSSALSSLTVPSFSREERKYQALPPAYRLPKLISKNMVVDFQIYIDVSGSVASYVQQFIDASLSIIENALAQEPEIEAGNIDYLIFGDNVRNVTAEINSPVGVELNVGFGTNFPAIQKAFEDIGNVDAFVFIITDGYGFGKQMQTTDRWYWLIYNPYALAQEFNQEFARILKENLPPDAKAYPFNLIG